MLCYTMLWYAMMWNTMLLYSMMWHTMLCYAMICYAMICYAILWYSILWHTMMCCAILWYDMMLYAMICTFFTFSSSDSIFYSPVDILPSGGSQRRDLSLQRLMRGECFFLADGLPPQWKMSSDSPALKLNFYFL